MLQRCTGYLIPADDYDTHRALVEDFRRCITDWLMAAKSFDPRSACCKGRRGSKVSAGGTTHRMLLQRCTGYLIPADDYDTHRALVEDFRRWITDWLVAAESFDPRWARCEGRRGSKVSAGGTTHRSPCISLLSVVKIKRIIKGNR